MCFEKVSDLTVFLELSADLFFLDVKFVRDNTIPIVEVLAELNVCIESTTYSEQDSEAEVSSQYETDDGSEIVHTNTTIDEMESSQLNTVHDDEQTETEDVEMEDFILE